MTVMIEPVTTGGKKRMICEKNGEIASPISAATMTAPKTFCRPSWPSSPMIESIVATDANEIPCTSGSWEPKNGSPSVCSSVAAPLTNSAHASSVPISRAAQAGGVADDDRHGDHAAEHREDVLDAVAEERRDGQALVLRAASISVIAAHGRLDQPVRAVGGEEDLVRVVEPEGLEIDEEVVLVGHREA